MAVKLRGSQLLRRCGTGALDRWRYPGAQIRLRSLRASAAATFGLRLFPSVLQDASALFSERQQICSQRAIYGPNEPAEQVTASQCLQVGGCEVGLSFIAWNPALWHSDQTEH